MIDYCSSMLSYIRNIYDISIQFDLDKEMFTNYHAKRFAYKGSTIKITSKNYEVSICYIIDNREIFKIGLGRSSFSDDAIITTYESNMKKNNKKFLYSIEFRLDEQITENDDVLCFRSYDSGNNQYEYNHKNMLSEEEHFQRSLIVDLPEFDSILQMKSTYDNLKNLDNFGYCYVTCNIKDEDKLDDSTYANKHLSIFFDFINEFPNNIEFGNMLMDCNRQNIEKRL